MMLNMKFPLSAWHYSIVVACMVLMLTMVTSSPAAASPPTVDQIRIPDTSYAIPVNAIYVDINASAGADDGSVAHPFHSIGQALNAAPAGATIVVHEGRYRESLGAVNRRVTIQPYPHEQVWLLGSAVARNWVADPMTNTWSTPLRGRFCLNAAGAYAPATECYPPTSVVPQYPAAGLPDMVFMDGVPVQQVASRAAVAAGTFYADYAGGQLIVGSNPVGRTVETSQYARAFWTVASGTTIRGIGIAHFAPHRNTDQGAMAYTQGADITIENMVFAWSSTNGLSVQSTGVTIRGTSFIANGQIGLNAWKADDLVVDGSSFSYNNIEHFVAGGAYGSAAGSKIVRSARVTIRRSSFDDNYATGLWFDLSDTAATVVTSAARRNAHHGMYYEVSDGGTFASNVAADNVDNGIYLSNASNTRIYNNTMVRNGIGLAVVDGAPTSLNDPGRCFGLVTCISAGNAAVGNVIVDGAQGSTTMAMVRDYDSLPRKSATDLLGTTHSNVWSRSAAGRPAAIAQWWTPSGASVSATSLAQLRASFGAVETSSAQVDAPGVPTLVDAMRDWHVNPASTIAQMRVALPSDIATAIGSPTSVQPGAITWPGSAAAATTFRLPTTASPMPIVASYQGWSYVSSPTVSPVYRWTANGWQATTFAAGTPVWAYPFASGWQWAYRGGEWYAIATARLARWSCESPARSVRAARATTMYSAGTASSAARGVLPAGTSVTLSCANVFADATTGATDPTAVRSFALVSTPLSATPVYVVASDVDG